MLRRAFATLALATLFGAWTPAYAKAEPVQTAFMVDGAVALEAYKAVVEEHLTGVLRCIRGLASTSDAQSGDWGRIRPALERFSADLPTDATVFYARPDGSYLATATGESAESLGDRSYFPALLAGKDVVGALVISKSTGHRSVIVATPVMRDGRVVAAIGVSLRARLIGQLVTDNVRFPADLIFYALDASGETAIHTDPALLFEFPSIIGDATLKAAVAAILGQREGTVHYRFRDTARTAIFRASDMTGWRFVLAKLDK